MAATARRIRPNTRSITGYFPSQRATADLYFESKLEYHILLLLDWDSSVRSLSTQTERVEFSDDRGNHRYTPDILVRYKDNSVKLIEVKYREDLLRDWAELHPKLRAAARFARHNGWEFLILTEENVPASLLANIKQLRSLRSALLADYELNLICAAFDETPARTVRDLQSNLEELGVARSDSTNLFWRALATGVLWVDLNADITYSSVAMIGASHPRRSVTRSTAFKSMSSAR